MTCLFGHKWDGCKCTKCGITRDEQHDWNGCMCKRCGKKRDEQHDWDLCSGKCRRCLKRREEQHDWDGTKCKRCGKTRKLPPVIKQTLGECVAGDHFVFGKWKGAPLLWTVLQVQDDRLLLITDACLGAKAFHRSGTAAWDTCTLRTELNGDYFYRNNSVFNDTEREAILSTTNDSPGIYYQNIRNWEEFYANGGGESQDFVFLLSVADACNYFNVTEKGEMRDGMGYKAYEFPKSERLAAEVPWWLRNSTRKGSAAVVVTTAGLINYCGFTASEDSIPQVRPALWIRK